MHAMLRVINTYKMRFANCEEFIETANSIFSTSEGLCIFFNATKTIQKRMIFCCRKTKVPCTKNWTFRPKNKVFFAQTQIWNLCDKMTSPVPKLSEWKLHGLSFLFCQRWNHQLKSEWLIEWMTEPFISIHVPHKFLGRFLRFIYLFMHLPLTCASRPCVFAVVQGKQKIISCSNPETQYDQLFSSSHQFVRKGTSKKIKQIDSE